MKSRTNLIPVPVLGQARVPINFGDTADVLAARVLTAEHQLYPAVLASIRGRRQIASLLGRGNYAECRCSARKMNGDNALR